MKKLIKLINSLTANNIIHMLIMAITMTLISACGGGSSDNATTPTQEPETPNVVTTTTQETETETETPSVVTTIASTQESKIELLASPTSLDDLIVTPDNEMQAAFELIISLDINSLKRTYFSLCDDYSGSNNSYTVNFNSCIYRGPLTNGKLDTNIKVANHNNELLAVLWFYDGTLPQFQLWQYDSQLVQQLLKVN